MRRFVENFRFYQHKKTNKRKTVSGKIHSKLKAGGFLKPAFISNINIY